LFDDVYFSNYGDIEVQNGTLSLTGNGGSAGRWTVAAGTTLNFGLRTHSFESTTINGPGLARFNGATANFNGQATLENVALISGSANFNAPASVGTLSFNGGLLGGSNTVTVTNLIWTGGSMDGGGTTIIPTDGTMVITGADAKYLGTRVLRNAGDGTWGGSGVISAGSGILNYFSNEGTLTVVNDVTYAWNGAFYAAFYNQGRFVKAASTGSTFFNGVPFINNGKLEPQLGTLQFGGGFTQTSTGILEPWIGGRIGGTEFGRVTVTGQANLNGALRVRMVNGFQPAGGNQFTVMTYGSRNGIFSTFTVTNLAGGILLNTNYLSTSLRLTTTDNRPQLGGVTRGPNGELHFSINTLDGQSYEVQASTNLLFWLTLTNLPAGAGTYQVFDPAAVGLPYRFYRAVAP